VTIVFSSLFDFFNIRIQCRFNFIFFGVEDINSSALSVIGFAQTYSSTLGVIGLVRV